MSVSYRICEGLTLNCAPGAAAPEPAASEAYALGPATPWAQCSWSMNNLILDSSNIRNQLCSFFNTQCSKCTIHSKHAPGACWTLNITHDKIINATGECSRSSCYLSMIFGQKSLWQEFSWGVAKNIKKNYGVWTKISCEDFSFCIDQVLFYVFCDK